MPEEKNKSLEEIFSDAEEAEMNNEMDEAIKLYNSIVESDNLYIAAYDKLMKLYRKQKNYKGELTIINKGLKAYQAYYKMHKPKHSKAVDTISGKLNKSLGLVDKKGNTQYNPEPLGKWEKRKLIVQKKLNQ